MNSCGLKPQQVGMLNVHFVGHHQIVSVLSWHLYLHCCLPRKEAFFHTTCSLHSLLHNEIVDIFVRIWLNIFLCNFVNNLKHIHVCTTNYIKLTGCFCQKKNEWYRNKRKIELCELHSAPKVDETQSGTNIVLSTHIHTCTYMYVYEAAQRCCVLYVES